KQVAELVGLPGQVLDVIALERVVQRALGRGDRQRALRGDQARGIERPLPQLAGVVDRVHETDSERLVRVDDTAGEDELLRDAGAAYAGEPLRAAPTGDDPEVDLGLSELRGAGCIADVAGERELAASAESEAVDRRDRRLRRDLEQLSDP